MTTRYTNTNILLRMILAATAVMMLWSCSTFPEDEMYIGHSSDGRPTNGSQGGRDSGTHRNKVFIVYSMGFNNLSYDLNEDINDLLSSDIPSFRQDDDAILVLNHSTLNNSSNYKVETSPALYHAYKMNDGSIKRDTLIVFPEGSVAATKEMLSEVLNFVKEKFPARHYGMLVSSHATGWTPEMYCYNPPDKSPAGGWKAREKDFVPLDKYLDDRPLTKSIGAHFHGSSANMDEIDLTDFAAAIPFHLDFLVFDCCLMGGVEVAYELREKCDKICFSQTEILAGGMDYTTMISHIFDNEEVNKVKLGKEISFGGFTLPIDDNARTRLTEARVVTIPLADVVAGTNLIEKLGENPCIMLEQPAEGQHTPLRLERLARTLSQMAGVERILTHTSERPCGGHVLQQLPILTSWQQLTTACVALLFFLWIMPFVPGLLRWLILLALPAGILWFAAEAVQHKLWFNATSILTWWLILAFVFLIHRTYDKGLFGKRRK